MVEKEKKTEWRKKEKLKKEKEKSRRNHKQMKTRQTNGKTDIQVD